LIDTRMASCRARGGIVVFFRLNLTPSPSPTRRGVEEDCVKVFYALLRHQEGGKQEWQLTYAQR